jgi:hypothetical protein
MHKKKILLVTMVLTLSMVACQLSYSIPGTQKTNQVLPTLAPASPVTVPISAVNPNLTADQDLLVRLYDVVSPGVVLIPAGG